MDGGDQVSRCRHRQVRVLRHANADDLSPDYVSQCQCLRCSAYLEFDSVTKEVVPMSETAIDALLLWYNEAS